MNLKRYFFVSKTRLKDNILYPRIPDNRLTRNGLEESVTKRICVSQSLIGCLHSTEIYYFCKTIYLYSCLIDSNKVIQPSEKQVNDVIWTGEEWIVEPVEMKLVTILHVKKELISDTYCKYIIQDKKSDGFYKTEMCQHI